MTSSFSHGLQLQPHESCSPSQPAAAARPEVSFAPRAPLWARNRPEGATPYANSPQLSGNSEGNGNETPLSKICSPYFASHFSWKTTSYNASCWCSLAPWSCAELLGNSTPLEHVLWHSYRTEQHQININLLYNQTKQQCGKLNGKPASTGPQKDWLWWL
jgi:hypothetical protein